MKSLSRILTTTAFVVSSLAAAHRAAADGPKGTATIKGTVKLSAPPPKAMAIQMTADAYCQTAHAGKQVMPQGKMVFPDGTLPYAIVYLKSGVSGKYDAPTTAIEIDQNGCMYKPHVQGMVAGQPINVKNSDNTNHNIHSQAKKNPQFNFSQPKQGMVKELKGTDTFTKSEIVWVKCDVHPWMGAYIGVFDHPFFATSGKGGTFEITGVPAGKYTLTCWHEEWGSMDAEIEVKDGATVEQTFTYAKKMSAAPAHEVQLSANR